MEDTLDFRNKNVEEIQKLLEHYRITLTAQEAVKIQNEILQRPPTLAECILWSIQGSEHCSYKSSQKYLKQFITTGQNVILGPSEDAGIVEVARDAEGHRYGVVMSHESHNHPSQVVPYEGAATGIGGNVRDVSCMGAKVIANADPLRFGSLKNRKTQWICGGVVGGIAGYSNPIGVPTIAGDAYFDESYNENCLVNVVTLGIVRDDEIIHSRAPKNANGYDLILVGKATDNSGFGGAAFASLQLDNSKKDLNKGAVQEPNAFLKRHLLKSLYTLLPVLKERKLMHLVGLKDLGAGGIACASVEIADAAGYGAEVNLDLVSVGMKNLAPAIILCSETQERYLWASHPDVTPLILQHYNSAMDLPRVAAGAKASVIGRIRDDRMFVVTYQGKKIVDAKASDVTRGLQYDRPFKNPGRIFSEPHISEPVNYTEIFLEILSHPNVASREPIYERYDKQVQGITVLEPGRADAGVMQPFKDVEFPQEIQVTGIALSVDQNPRYCKIDPYQGAVNAVLESARNVAAVGAYPVAFTDCLNFGNPEKPEQMWEFAEGTRGVADAAKALNVPIISGNVSLYNESKEGAIAPSPIIACLGTMPDASKAISMAFKKEGSFLYMIGERKNECGGSVYYDLRGELGASIPQQEPTETHKQISALVECIQNGLILSTHDISDGGIAITLAEMSFENEIGFSVSIPGNLRADILFFSETPGFVIEIDSENEKGVLEIFQKQSISPLLLGKTTSSKTLSLNNILAIDLFKAKSAWKEGLRKKL